MKKLTTKQAERVYDALQAYADISPSPIDREEFMYHFSVLSNTSDRFTLKTADEVNRTLVYFPNGSVRLEGKGSARVNPVIEKILANSRTMV